MKRFLTLMLLVLSMLFSLSNCGCGDMEADLVFVNDSDAVIVTVVADFYDQDTGTRNADSSPLKRGESFGFEAGEYPVTVLVYDRAVSNVSEQELAQITIQEAPPDGERWYVTARDGASGLTLSVSELWPNGV